MSYTSRGSQLAELCRFCMSTMANGTRTYWPNIFTGADSKQLLFIIQEVIGHEVKQDEYLPECICSSCLAAARTAFYFKRRFEKSLQLIKQNRTRVKDAFLVTREKTCNSVSEKSGENDLKSLIEDYIVDCESKEKQLGPQTGKWSSQNTEIKVQPFECSQCSETFNEIIHLTKHLRTHAIAQKFECSYCSKTFIHGSTLTSHLRTHTGERPFKCSHCTLSFSAKGHLNRHLRTHTGERPFKCTQCSNTYTQSSGLKSHLLTHTGERPFKCSQCSKSFARCNSLRAHLRSHNVIKNQSEQ